MTLKTLAAASCLSMAMATATFAAPITLDFAFHGVTGTFYGLDDADGTGSATSFDLTFQGSSWTNVPSSSVVSNEFVFRSGALAAVDFVYKHPLVQDDRRFLILQELYLDSSSNNSFLFVLTQSAPGIASGPPTFTINPVAAVPLPAGGLLLLTAFGGVAALKRRKKRAA